MVTKNQIRYIQSLKDASSRRKNHAFLVEGPKLVEELLQTQAFTVQGIYGLQDWTDVNQQTLEKYYLPSEIITQAELDKISCLTTPNQVVAVVAIPPLALDWKLISNDLSLMLDGIQDPGNLGTIIRIADWFGIGQIICSMGSADVYNPKVVQATMGSIYRVKVFYQDLPAFLDDLPGDIPVFGALLDGEPLTDVQLPENGILVIGSESHGISAEVVARVKNRVKIPAYIHAFHSRGAESLNASVATAILCYEFRFRSQAHAPHC